jgi:uncharacterized protein
VIVPEGLIIVFARAPVPGRAKTRLIPLLGPDGAAALQESMTRHGLAVGLKAGLGPVELWTADHPNHPFFRRCRRELGIGVHRQPEGDLGQRMAVAFEEALRRAPWALLTGTDCPCLKEADLQRAAEALVQGKEAVLAPAEDGGYVLLGLRRFNRALFEGIAWGSAQVLEETRSRLRALGWGWHEIRTCWDVDRPEDVGRLRREGFFGLPVAQPEPVKPLNEAPEHGFFIERDDCRDESIGNSCEGPKECGCRFSGPALEPLPTVRPDPPLLGNSKVESLDPGRKR